MGWASIDSAAAAVGCTYTASLIENSAGDYNNNNHHKMVLSMLSTTKLRGKAKASAALQVWLGCTYTAETEKITTANSDKCCDIWVVTTLPAAAAETPPQTPFTIQLLQQQQQQQQQEVDDGIEQQQRACAALMNGYKAAVWIADRGSSLKRRCSICTSVLSSYRGPPPCFVFAVHVLERHLSAAIKEMKPSVSLQELKRYERMREQFAAR